MADPLDNQTSGEQLRRLLLREEQERLDQLEARLGDEEALKSSLIPIIADVLRDAGVQDYRRLAGALAPIVLQSIKTEIHNSRDMMVDALYPITGRLVAAAVRNAFRDLVEQLNQKLDSSLSADRWRSRIKAKMTGRSEAEILLSEGAAFEITDLLLINRETGLLVAQAGKESDQGGMDSQLLGSILTAIMAFVRDAMQNSPEQDLRTLHVGDMRLHMQVSPGAILAVKTKGPPPPGFDSAFNETFCAFLAQWGEAISDPDNLEKQQEVALTDDLENRFQGLLKAKQENFKGPSKKGTILLGSLAAIAIGLLGWHLYGRWQTSSTETTARSVIADRPSLVGYPLQVRYQSDDGTLAITGLTPNNEEAMRLRMQLEKALPDTELMFDVQGLPETTVALDHLITRPDFAQSKTALEIELKADVERKTQALQTAIEQVEEVLPTEEERKVLAFRSWLDRQALYFGDGDSFYDETSARTVLKDIAERMQDLPDEAAVLIVGYADDSGGQVASARVSLGRADLVSRRLKNLGVVSKSLITVGRGSENRVSQESGPGSANRRVEFELNYRRQPKALPEPAMDSDLPPRDGDDVER